ncbi:hypothetical protein ECDEC10B_3354 [Escherichia coli DEC10B]|nr:hypothetical protein ECDEC10B_3354 [Escherichia coli DEC10B]
MDSCQPLTLAVFSLYPACIAASVGFVPFDNASANRFFLVVNAMQKPRFEGV